MRTMHFSGLQAPVLTDFWRGRPAAVGDAGLVQRKYLPTKIHGPAT